MVLVRSSVPPRRGGTVVAGARRSSALRQPFAVDDVERTYRELSERGVEFTQPPRKEEWGTSAVFRDPDGNQFVIGDS